MDKELDLFEKNDIQDLKNELAIRKSIGKNRRVAEKLRRQLKTEIDAGKGGTVGTERMLRNLQKYEEIIKTQEKDLPDLKKQYKLLIRKLRGKFPEKLEKIKEKQEKELIRRLDRLILLMEEGR